MNETQISYMKIKNKCKMVTFQEKPSMPMNQLVHDLLRPFLIQSMDQKVQIVIRELNYIPNNICFEQNDYKKILHQLVKNSLHYSKKSNLLIIDISYFEIKDVEQGHRESVRGDCSPNNNLENENRCEGFLVTRVIDSGCGISTSAIKQALRSSHSAVATENSSKFKSDSVYSGLKIVSQLVKS